MGDLACTYKQFERCNEEGRERKLSYRGIGTVRALLFRSSCSCEGCLSGVSLVGLLRVDELIFVDQARDYMKRRLRHFLWNFAIRSCLQKPYWCYFLVSWLAMAWYTVHIVYSGFWHRSMHGPYVTRMRRHCGRHSASIVWAEQAPSLDVETNG